MSVAAPVEETSTAAQAYSWPFRDKAAVEIENEVIGKRRKMSFKLLDGAYWFRFVPINSQRPSAVQYTLRFAQDDVVVSLSGPIPDEWIAPPFRGVLKENLPAELVDIVLEASVAPLLQLLGSASGATPQMIRGATSAVDTTSMSAFAWEAGREGKDALISGEFWLPPASLPKLTAALHPVKTEARAGWDQLPFQATVEVGSTALSWREIRSVQANDIVLLDEAFPLDKSECLVLIGDKKITAKRTDNRVITSGRFTSISAMANATVPAKDEPASAASGAPSLPVVLEDLPVRLSFTVGDAELSFRELKSLQEGYTFVLNRPVSAPVQIRIQGAVVGTGELLQVGDQIGVRVTELHLGT